MRKKLIVANWKMKFTVGESSLFLNKLQEKVVANRNVEVVICPNVLTLQSLSLQIDRRKFKLGAQNCYYKDEGAFTGEVSASMLRGIANYIIIGHSERRHIFCETDKLITQKVQAVLRSGLKPILCVGETKNERIAGETAHTLHAQVTAGLANVTSEEIKDVVIAYEPVWAIGTGDFAKSEDAMTAAKYIRRQVEGLFGKKAAEEIQILYGGSVDTDNAGSYLAAEDVDGLLVGGASLKADAFATIIGKANEIATA
ncbi:MAG TPA: triose-phosphate isomerase [Candidatus Saccharimonadales bacterium]|nr:triose-phosphate isomerase [Candidatus Saccharimonadales bacterium]